MPRRDESNLGRERRRGMAVSCSPARPLRAPSALVRGGELALRHEDRGGEAGGHEGAGSDLLRRRAVPPPQVPGAALPDRPAECLVVHAALLPVRAATQAARNQESPSAAP